MTQLDMEHGYWSFVIFSSFYWLLWWPFRELKIFGYMGIWIYGKIMFCSHKSQRYSRAYIDFKNPEDVLEFAGFFHGHVFVNEKGTLVANLLWIAWNFLACLFSIFCDLRLFILNGLHHRSWKVNPWRKLKKMFILFKKI
jgi:hypothetical protein